MIDYLKDFGLTDEEIENINETIYELNLDDLFEFNYEKVIAILNLFKEHNIDNYYELIMYNPNLFRDTVQSIKDRLDSYKDKEELTKLVKEDINNLSLIYI